MTALRARLASGNAHKLEELRAALPGWELELARVDSYPPETGETYVDNARAKALHAYGHMLEAAWVLGEDSGVEVDALGGAPGLRSARWAGDADPVDALLRRLEGVPPGRRRARYVCELVAVGPRGEEIRGTGVLEGEIALDRRGSEGFGYDPVFVPLGERRTVAELGDAWKRRHSHRALAAAALRERLEQLA